MEIALKESGNDRDAKADRGETRGDITLSSSHIGLVKGRMRGNGEMKEKYQECDVETINQASAHYFSEAAPMPK